MRQFYHRKVKQSQVRNSHVRKITNKKKKDYNLSDSVENKTGQLNPQSNKDMAQPKLNIDTIIKILTNFDGTQDSDIENFLNSFEELTNELDVSEKLKIIILKSKLKGIAKQYVVEDPQLNSANEYQQFKDKLIKLFKKEVSVESLQAKFLNIKQLPQQTITEFVRDFDLAANRYLKSTKLTDQQGSKDLLDSLKLTKFLENIRQDISLEVRKNMPSNYKEAFEMALRIERAFLSIPIESINTQTDKHNDMCEQLLAMHLQQNAEIKSLREQLEKQNVKMENSKGNNSNKQQLFCAICKINSHVTESCWFNAKSQNFKQTKAASNFNNKQLIPFNSFSHNKSGYKNQNRFNNNNSYRKRDIRENSNGRSTNNTVDSAENLNLPAITFPDK